MTDDCNLCVKVDEDGNEVVLESAATYHNIHHSHGSCYHCHCNPCQCKTTSCDKPVKCETKTTDCKTVQHLHPIIQTSFAPVAKSNGKAIMPEVDKSNVLSFPESEVIAEGTILYHVDVGYIEIVSFDKKYRLATFRNSSAFVGRQVIQPGEYIPQDIYWATGIPSYGGGALAGDNCFLALDFIVPPLNGTAYASFTSTDCFASGDGIRIDGQILSVVNILSETQALLKNLDASNEVGREIIAKDVCDVFSHNVVVVNNTISDRVDECLTRDGSTVIPIANLDMDGFKHINAIPASASGEYVTFEQFAWIDWTPVISVSGGATIADTVITFAKYQLINKKLEYKIKFDVTLGGTATDRIFFTLPVNNNGDSIANTAHIVDNATRVGGFAHSISASQLEVIRHDSANYTAGAIGVVVYGFYEIA